MYIVIFISLVALLLTFLDSKKIMANGMRWGVVLITILGCIHYDYGNDYMEYLDIYNTIIKYPFNWQELVEGNVFKESGWALLCYLFEPLGGFFMMVAVLNVIQNVLVYRTIKHNVEKKWWPMAISIYLFSNCLYLLNFSMMRQGFVVCVFLGLWPWIEQRKWLKTFLVLLLCYSIHKSALFLLPFAFGGFIPTNQGRLLVVVLVGFYVALWFIKGFIDEFFLLFMTVDGFGDYSNIYGNEQVEASFRFGYLIKQLPFVLGLLYLFQDKNNKCAIRKSFVLFAMISFLIVPFSRIIHLISRLSFYFVSYEIIAVPVIYDNIKNKWVKSGLLGIYIFMMLYDYFSFFKDPIWVNKYTTFKTIFSQML